MSISDNNNSKWFKHRGDTIIGLSKFGINAIVSAGISVLTFPTVIDGVKIAYIGEYATEEFSELIPNVHTIVVPEGISLCGMIGNYDFFRSGTMFLDVSEGIKTIIFEDDSSYSPSCIGNSISDIIILKGEKYTSVDGVVFSKNGTRLEYYPRGKRIPRYIVPETVSEIAPEAFMRCVIDEVIIPDNVTSLGKRFAWDSKIKRLVIGSGIIEIPAESCPGSTLEELTLHEGLEIIGEKAFERCKVPMITIPSTVKRINKDAFRDSTSRFTFLSDDVLIGPHAFYGCTSEGTNYSPKIEGKMQRCGYSKFDYYDEYCGVTRDMAIEKLKAISKTEIDIPETTRIDEILKMIKCTSS